MDNQIEDIKKHESQLLQKQMDLEVKMAHFEEKQEHTEELIKDVKQSLTDVKQTLTEEIHQNIDKRISDMAKITDGQQKTLNKIIEVQGKQTQQIDTIQHTLDHFTKIEDKVTKIEKEQEGLEIRIGTLENNTRTAAEIRKEKIKGMWTVISSAVAAASAIVCALIAAFR